MAKIDLSSLIKDRGKDPTDSSLTLSEFLKKEGIESPQISKPKTAVFGLEPVKEVETTPSVLETISPSIGPGDVAGLAKLAKIIQEGTVRSGAAVGLSSIAFGVEKLGPIVGLTTEESKIEADKIRTVGVSDNIAAKLLFGEGPIKSIETIIAESEIKAIDIAKELEKDGITIKTEFIKSLGKTVKTPLGDISPLALAVPFIVGLDFVGGGGKGPVIKFLTKANKVDDVVKVLKQINVADDLIDDVARVIAKTSDEKTVTRIITNIEKIQDTTKAIAPKGVKVKTQIRETTGQVKIDELALLNEKLRVQAQAARRATATTKVKVAETTKALKEERSFLQSIKKDITKGLEKVKNDIRKKIGFQRKNKELSGTVLSRLKEKNGIKEWKNANKEQLQAVLDDILLLRKGDQMVSKAQIESLRRFGIKPWTTKREAVAIIGDVSKFKDRGARFFNFFKTIDQKIEKIAGKQADQLKDILTRPREQNVTDLIKEEVVLKTEMKDMMSRLGVGGKKARKLTMRFGEGRMTLDQLKKEMPDKWQNIVEADKWFRNKYNELLDSTNDVLRKFYPEDQLIPKRKDYYTHSQELGAIWNEIKNVGGDINPALEATSEFTRPNRRFNPFALRRTGGVEFVEDAGKAFEAYLTPILHNKHLTEDIIRHRAVADILAHNTLETKNVNQFIFSLRDSADNLAGKTNPFDRALMNRVVSRPVISLISKVSGRLAKNRIIGSAGSALMQISGIPSSVLKNNIIRTSKGLLTQAVSPFLGTSDHIFKSKFLLRRYGALGLRHGETVFPTIIKKGEEIASIPFEIIEKNITKAIWRASFDNAYSQGFRGAQLVQKADEITASIVGARSIGEKALAFESGILSLPLQFQLEVNTHAQLWFDEVFSKIITDPAKASRAALETTITLLLFNTFFEETLGRTPLPDPIRAILDASKRDTWPEAIGRLAGEGLSSVAGGQFIANLLPRDVKQKYFGRSEVGIYPGGIPVVQAVSKDFGNLIKGRPGDFIYDFVLPFGGAQLKRIIQGLEGVDKMGSFNKDGKLQFPINQNEWFKIITFGKYSTKEAREFFDKQRTPLTEQQSVEYFIRTQKGEDPQEVYNDVAKTRITNERKREIVKILVKKIKANPKEGLAIIQLWRSEGILDSEMEKDILEAITK